ncbi:MAG: phosphoadenylyl-sulfate reductase [Gemmataceae bacterium]
MVVARMSEADVEAANRELADATPEAILRWAVREFHPRLTMATAFGAEGCCLIHMLAEIEPTVRIFNLDTGYQFPETLELRERLLYRYGIAVEFVRPEQTVAEYEAHHNGPLYLFQPDQCCHDRKIVPLQKSLVGYDAWLSGIRGDQTEHRKQAVSVAWDRKFGLHKVSPLLSWTRKDVWRFIAKYDIPYNPLHDHNYPSIGCAPCTRAVVEGEDERAGRWSGSAKKECGLHVMPEHEQGSGI